MAVSNEVETYQLLNAWPEICMQDIWAYNQAVGAGAPLTRGCEGFIQDEREQIARAANAAWNQVTSYLGYFPSPQWYSQRVFFGKGSPWQWQELQAEYGRLIEFGARATTLIDDDVTITYSDEDGDGVHDTATITVTTSVTNDEIQVFFRTADGAPGAADPRYQIEPIRVSASGGTVTIKAHRALFVKPDGIWDTPFKTTDPNKIDRNYADTANGSAGFVTAVDVYRVYNDPTNAVQVLTDPIYSQQTNLGQSLASVGVARIVNPTLGIFQARMDDCGGCPPNWVESVYVSYRSGLPLGYDRRMDGRLREALCRLANVHLARDLCPFSQSAREVWQEDRENAEVAEGDSAVNNPFGIKVGELRAWRAVADRAMVRGGTL